MQKSLFSLLFILLSLQISASSILIPMDAETQKDHLKAYGITYWVLSKQQKVQWLLNYRGGSFLLPDGENIRKAQKTCESFVHTESTKFKMKIRDHLEFPTHVGEVAKYHLFLQSSWYFRHLLRLG